MTAPSPTPPSTPWFLRPAVGLPAILLLIVASVILAPQKIGGRSGDERLTVTSADPQGARLFAELTKRLGWRVDERLVAELPAGDSIIHAILAPPNALRRPEVHALLEQVRHGAAAFIILRSAEEPLADSLQVMAVGAGYSEAPPGFCPSTPSRIPSLWADEKARLLMVRPKGPALQQIQSLHSVTPFNEKATGMATAMISARLGAGRVVVAMDPDVIRNDVLRICRHGTTTATVRALEFLRDGGPVPRRRMVVDEYHQGRGLQPGAMATVGHFLSGVPLGRALLQACAAVLVLLMALAPRLIAPTDPPVVERRSPLEHVEALARAYEQVGAARTVVQRLVEGVRRRIEGASRRGRPLTDAMFLDMVARQTPALAPDVARVQQALAHGADRASAVAVGASLARIESSILP